MPKKRKESSRPVRERILILCEGRETEPNYFKGIKTDKGKENRLTALRIEVYDTRINTGKELVQLAKDLKEKAIFDKNAYDSVWIVMDRDGYTKHPHAFDQAEANDIRIAFSSIAFEYWFLLHFFKANKPFKNADELIEDLKEHYPNYKKSDDHYAYLKNRMDTAVANAVWLRKEIAKANRGHKPYEFNPYTNVDKLVSYLLGLQ